MSTLKLVRVGAIVLLMGSAIYAADSAAPAAGDASAPHKGHGRLTKPWNELKDLKPEERTKILAVHQKALDEVHAIEAKEHEDILALLSDDQKKEVAAIEAKEKAAAHAHATTQPAAANAK